MTSGRQRTVERHVEPAGLDAAIRAARREGRAARLQRLCFVKNCYAGDSATEAARRVGVSRTTGARWLDRWNADGLDGLDPAERSGRPPKLAGDDREAAREALAEAAPLTTDAAGELLRERFGVDYAQGYLPRLLRSLGFRYLDSEDVDGAGSRDGGTDDEGPVAEGGNDERAGEAAPADHEVDSGVAAARRPGGEPRRPVLVPRGYSE